MIDEHKFYEAQSALSATGHLSEAELAELEQHVLKCPQCRAYLADIAAISRQVFLTQDRPAHQSFPNEMHDRFIQRAIAAGIPLKHDLPSPDSDYRMIRVAAIIVVLAFLLSVGWRSATRPFVRLTSANVPSVTDKATDPLMKEAAPLFLKRVSQLPVVTRVRAKNRASTPTRAVLHASSVLIPAVKTQICLAPTSSLRANRDLPTSIFDPNVYWARRLNGSYLMAGMHSARLSSATDNNSKEFLKGQWYEDSGKHSFHLDLTAASLPRLNSSLGSQPDERVLAGRFNLPSFHLDPSRSW